MPTETVNTVTTIALSGGGVAVLARIMFSRFLSQNDGRHDKSDKKIEDLTKELSDMKNAQNVAMAKISVLNLMKDHDDLVLLGSDVKKNRKDIQNCYNLIKEYNA